MKKIEAVIRDSKFYDVKNALTKVGVKGMTTFEVKGRGIELGDTGSGVLHGDDDMNPKRKIEIICIEEEVKKIVNTIATHAATSHVGDGKIFVSNIDDVIKIRTQEHGDTAI